MLTKIHELTQQSTNFIAQQIPALHLPKQCYQNYLAFLSQTCQEVTSDNHIIYLVKMVFDDVLDLFTDQDLLVLQEKQDMYLNYIMHSTFKNCGLVQEEEFKENVQSLINFYQPTSDQTLFIDKIEETIKGSLSRQISPFSYVEAYKQVFSEKVQTKLINMLKFMIGDSLCYKMSASSIFGLCLKWTIDRYQIKNSSINTLISQLIDVKNPETQQNLSQLTLIMSQIINMSSE